MKKFYPTYFFTVITIFVMGVLLQITYLNSLFDDYGVSTHPFYQTILSPINLAIIAAIGCALHWTFIVRRHSQVLSIQASRSLSLVLISAMLALLLGVGGFLLVIAAGIKEAPEVGLFMFLLPVIGVASLTVGAALGVALALLRKAKIKRAK